MGKDVLLSARVSGLLSPAAELAEPTQPPVLRRTYGELTSGDLSIWRGKL